MSLRKKFGTSSTAVEEGAWIDVCENEDGTTARLRIKRMNQQNPKYLKEIANHRRAFEGDSYSAKKLSQMQASMIEVLISTVITGWEYMEDWRLQEDGSPPVKKYMDFNPSNLRETLIEFPDLLDLITSEASNIRTFQGDELKN